MLDTDAVAAPVSGRAFCRAALAWAAAATCSGAMALPQFTFDPSAVGLAGPAFTADNLLVSDYATVVYGAGGAASETGFLSITGAQLGGTTISLPQLNSTYGLYIQFALSNQTINTFTSGSTTFVNGLITSLSYQLYGYNGTATFTPSSVTTSNPAILLGAGSLDGTQTSTTSATLTGSVPTAATASTFLTFAPNGANSGFFQSPSPFYNLGQASFTNSRSQITASPSGFTVAQGAGSLNFVQVIPEPGSYALMLGGLAAVGWVTRRRRSTI